MYVRTTQRQNRDGTTVRYVQLAHNEWDAAAKTSKTKVLYSFGRADQLDTAGVRRLVAALSRLLEPGEALAAAGPPELTFTRSRALGGAYVLDGLWRQLRIDTTIRALLRRRDARVERVLFALVANRALAPCSKLAATRWVEHDVVIDGLDQVNDEACYRAMDWLVSAESRLARAVYDATADLLNLEVDLLFFDTTSTYFQIDDPDTPTGRDEHGHLVDGDGDDSTVVSQGGFRSFGKSKDHRDDLPQIVIGLAVTRDGIPVRCWSWPGNRSDSALIRQVKTEMRDWSLGRVVWVADRGFTSAANRRHLQQGGGQYILGEKLRGGTPAADAALSRRGRYQQVRDNLHVKEVRLDSDLADDRFVVCYNPAEAQRDAARRDRHVTALTKLIDGSDKLGKTQRAELAGVLSTKPHLRRYLRTTPGGLLRIDKAAIARETNLDGKYLLRTSDPKLAPEDIALGYKQLLEVERAWRDLKTVIDLRPVHHRLEQRIRAHVLLCWLALLLARIAETRTGTAWPTLREELQRLHLGEFTGPAGTFHQRTELTQPHKTALAALGLPEPPRIWHATPIG